MNAIEVTGLGKRYGSVTAVTGLEMHVPERSLFGLIGPNGAGKTTTLSILCGFVRPSAGVVRVLGHDPADVGALKGRRSALPQDALMPGGSTVTAALAYYGELQGLATADARAAARRALAEVGLAEAADRKCRALSHGMAQRAALAQALIGEPELVLLDEPTSGLDPRAAHEVRQIIRAMRGKRTVVVSSHNLAELEELCDAAAILDRGKLAQQGTMVELTGKGESLRIGLTAAPALEPLRAVPGVASAQWDPMRGELSVRLRGGEPPEEVTARLLRALLDAGSRVTSLSSGRRLEERVLEVTK